MTASQRVSPLGWNILDTKRTVGGLLGYSSVNCIVNLKVPSSKGVSLGLGSEGNATIHKSHDQYEDLKNPQVKPAEPIHLRCPHSPWPIPSCQSINCIYCYIGHALGSGQCSHYMTSRTGVAFSSRDHNSVY